MGKYLALKVEKSKISDVEKHWDQRMPMMAMEEMGELIQAISKMERANDDYERSERMTNLVEELRDTYISLMALQIRYGIDMNEMVDEINMKLDMKKDN